MPFISGGGGGGGGGVGHTLESLTGANVSINNNSNNRVTWNTSLGPNTLLDLTDPTAPTVAAGGVYAVTVEVGAEDAMAITGGFELKLLLDNGVLTVRTYTSIDVHASTPNPFPAAALSTTRYLAAGATIEAIVYNLDGVSAINFKLTQACIALLGA